MANKNHTRYKIRKNSASKKSTSTISKPPILIHNWDELNGLENDMYFIDVDTEMCAGWVYSKNKTDEDRIKYYLSTHTFYGTSYNSSTAILQKYGFNVQLENWDGETLYYKK